MVKIIPWYLWQIECVLQPLEEIIGQEHIVGTDKLLHKAIKSKQLFSMILWGPPGVGKTTLVRIIANETGSDFLEFSTVNTSTVELKKIFINLQNSGKQTMIFIRVFVLKPLSKEELKKIVEKAIKDEKKGLGKQKINLTDEAFDLLLEASFGDGRIALNTLEIAYNGFMRALEDVRKFGHLLPVPLKFRNAPTKLMKE